MSTGRSAGPSPPAGRGGTPLAWGIVFVETPGGDVPAERYLDECPRAVRDKILATLQAVAEAPPPQFSGGGRWEAMHGIMAGYHEVRIDTAPPGQAYQHFRLYCYADSSAPGLPSPVIALLDGRTKPYLTTLSDSEYRAIKQVGTDYRHSNVRAVAPHRYEPGMAVPETRDYCCAGPRGRNCAHCIALRAGDPAPAMPPGCKGLGWRRKR